MTEISRTVTVAEATALNNALPASGGTLTNVKETRYAVTTSGNVTLDLANGNLQRLKPKWMRYSPRRSVSMSRDYTLKMALFTALMLLSWIVILEWL